MSIGSLQLRGGGFVYATNSCAFGMTLPPGSSCAVEIVGTPNREGLQQAEAILNASSGPYRIPLAVTGTVAPPPPLNFEGAWWNAPPGSEDGWGLTLAHQDDAIFTTWFTYGDDGEPLWLSMTAFRVGNANEFAGTLYRTTGPPLTIDPFTAAAVQYVAVGTGRLSFSDADHGTFAYTIGNTSRTKSLARFSFGPLPTCTFAGTQDPARDHKFEGNWWTAGGAESGWAFI